MNEIDQDKCGHESGENTFNPNSERCNVRIEVLTHGSILHYFFKHRVIDLEHDKQKHNKGGDTNCSGCNTCNQRLKIVEMFLMRFFELLKRKINSADKYRQVKESEFNNLDKSSEIGNKEIEYQAERNECTVDFRNAGAIFK